MAKKKKADNFAKQQKRFRRAFAGFQEIMGSGMAGDLIRDVMGQELDLLQSLGPEFIREQSRLRDLAFESDPVMREQRLAALDALGVARGQLADLEAGGLPADLERSILERTRTSQAARGIHGSPVGATAEAVRLLGGEEQLRSQRLGQAMGILSGGGFGTAAPAPGMGPGPTRFLPGGDLMPGLQQNVMASRQQHEAQLQQGFQNRFNMWQQGIGTAISGAGMVGMMGGIGGFAPPG
jgi:hypothetical protein